jgi:uncharacterized glyoxalase superfamily protein PhnB
VAVASEPHDSEENDPMSDPKSNPKNTLVNIIPALRYADAAKAIDWLCDAFAFERKLVVPGEDGAIAHAQLRYGNGMLMLGSGGAHQGPFDQHVQPPTSREQVRPSSVYVIVQDADAHCARARGAGAEILIEPEDADYGGRGYTCLDLEGNAWTFGTFDPFEESSEG